jgi:O-succinylbenzoic acid--CoA ligase
MTRRLVALDMPAGRGFVDALTDVWERGDAVFPVDQRLPPSAVTTLFEALAVGAVRTADGDERAVAGGRPVEDGDAVVVATSGSTGEPKGVVLTHAALAASARATSQRLGVTASDRWLACLPLSHVGGLAVVTRALLTGTALTVLPGFDAAAVDRSDATLVSLVATALARIDPAGFRLIVLGGAAAPDDVPPNTVVTYGMTETGSGIVYDGVPLDGVDVRLGGDGEIAVRGPMLLRAYRIAAGEVDPLVDGWLATGDVGSWLADGRLQVAGRRSELIISGGENVWPGPVERAIRRDPRIAEIVVTGTADPEWGEVVTAWMVPAGADVPTLEDVRGYVREVLPAYCAPRVLHVVERIPTTTLGKPRRDALRAPSDRRSDPDVAAE